MIDYTIENEEPYIMECDIIKDYLEFSGELDFELHYKVTQARSFIKKDYETYGSEFYSRSPNYIYDILSSNISMIGRANLINKFIPNGMKIIRDGGVRFCDFGAGTGAMCSLAKELGKTAIHVDLPGRAMDFAKWRYKKHNYEVDIFEISVDEPVWPGSADIMFSDAVWEHLSPDKQISYVDILAEHLSSNGILMLLVDLAGRTDEMPIHYDVDIGKVHKQIEKNGFKNEYGLNDFASVWRKQ